MSASRSRVLTWGSILAAWAVGIALGVMLGRARSRGGHETPEAPARIHPALPEAGPRSLPSTLPPSGEVRRLRDLLGRQEAELRVVDRQITVALQQSAGSRTREDKLKFARELYETYRRVVKTDDNDEFVALTKRFGELDPDMAPFFIEQYRNTHTEDHSHVPLELALFSGGREVSGLIVEILSSEAYTESERKTILSYVDGVSANVPVGGRLVVDGDLLGKARQLLGSDKTWERKGAAGLLGFSKSPEATPPLRKMAESDPDPDAKMAAFRALGRTKDTTNVAYLQEAQRIWETPAPKDKPIPMQAEILKAIRAAGQQLNQEVLQSKN